MLRRSVSSNLSVSVRDDAAGITRVAGITVTSNAFGVEPSAVQVALLWRVLDLAAAAEQRAQVILVRTASASIPAALETLIVLFRYGFRHPDEPIIAPLTAHYPALVRSLRELKVANNDLDESAALSAFAALATHLTTLSFYCVGFTSVGGLHDCCEYLRKVELCGCQHLSSIEGLAYHLYLEALDASETSITSVEPLRRCPALTAVSVSGCEALASLAGIEGHRSLLVVDVSLSGVTSLEPLRTCPALKEVSLQICHQLASLGGLEGHQRLEVVDASDTPITSIEPLRTCPALARVILQKCPQLPADLDLPAGVKVIRS